MNKKNFSPIIGIIVVAIAAATAWSAPKAPAESQPIKNAAGYTLAQIGIHNTAHSCWTAINGSAYDLTQWIAQHPGGEGAILSICGTDGSAAFNGQHGGQGKPAQILETFKIGPVIQ